MPTKLTTVFEVAPRRIDRDRRTLSLTRDALFDRYTVDGRHLPDGSLKTD
jgi:hypothetical protein